MMARLPGTATLHGTVVVLAGTVRDFDNLSTAADMQARPRQ